MKELENKIETFLKNECESRNWMCPKTASPGTPGFPDRIVITDNGTIVFVEVKRPGEMPRKLQIKMFLEPILKHKAPVIVVSTKAQVKELIYQLEHNIIPKPENTHSFYIKPIKER